MNDPTEQKRREGMVEIAADATSRQHLEARHGPVWDTAELTRDFTVIGFAAPLVVVRRKADGVKGSLEFQSHPRLYFNFEEHNPRGHRSSTQARSSPLGGRLKLWPRAARTRPSSSTCTCVVIGARWAPTPRGRTTRLSRSGGRLLSSYRTLKGVVIWLLTEAVGDDGRRASTCVTTPSEY